MTVSRYPNAKWMGQTPNTGGKFRVNPKILVQHYTAGYEGSAEYLWHPHKPNSSAHFVITREGKVFQLSDIDRQCWHAGLSKWRGQTQLNQYSIGIENENIGFMKRSAAGQWMTAASDYNHPFKGLPEQVLVSAHQNKPDGPKLGWEIYADKQIDECLKLTAWLIEQLPIREIVGHDDISPGRKSDPGPAFPMEKFEALLHPDASGQPHKAIVLTDDLNIRGGPGTTFEKKSFGPFAKGVKLVILKEDGQWAMVREDGGDKREGWVFSTYLALT